MNFKIPFHIAVSSFIFPQVISFRRELIFLYRELILSRLEVFHFAVG